MSIINIKIKLNFEKERKVCWLDREREMWHDKIKTYR